MLNQKKMMKVNILSVFIFTLLVACSSSNEDELNKKETIQVANGYFLLPPPGRSVTAGYFDIKNSTEIELSLFGVDSDKFSSIEIHEHKYVGDIMQMRKVDELKISSQESISMNPGGYHLMIFGIPENLTVGDVIDVNLKFIPHQIIPIKLTAR
tara:strand:+ start:24 stop:485 length:462 start_codon:yes stop_codon:yes gene_type:complete